MVLVGGRSPALGVFGVGVVEGLLLLLCRREARLRAPSLRRVDRPRGAARRSRLGLTAERRVRAIYTRVHFTQRGRGGIYIWICTLSSYPDSKLSVLFPHLHSHSRPLPRVRR